MLLCSYNCVNVYVYYCCSMCCLICFLCVAKISFVHISASCKRAFSAGRDDCQWDYVFNCAAETRARQSEEVYHEGIVKLSQNCAAECLVHDVKRYVEFSSANMCSSEKAPLKEDDPMEPWTFMARHKARVEKSLVDMDLNYTVLRLPIVYGCGDRRWLSKTMIFNVMIRNSHYRIVSSCSSPNCDRSSIQIPQRANETAVERVHEVEHRACKRCCRSRICIGRQPDGQQTMLQHRRWFTIESGQHLETARRYLQYQGRLLGCHAVEHH